MALLNSTTQMNGLIESLKRYDSEVISKTADKERLENEAEILSKAPFILGQQTLSQSGIGQSDIIGVTAALNSWIKWATNSTKSSDQIIGDAVWELYKTFKSSGSIKGTTFKIATYPTFESFYYRMLNSAILNQTSVKRDWTDYDRKLREVDVLDGEIDIAEKNYDDTYKLATALRDDKKYSVAAVKLDIYEDRKERRERRAKRKADRHARRDARKEVRDIINELEKKLNPIERVISADYTKALVCLLYTSPSPRD